MEVGKIKLGLKIGFVGLLSTVLDVRDLEKAKYITKEIRNDK